MHTYSYIHKIPYLFSAEGLWNIEVVIRLRDQKLVGKGFLQLNKCNQ